MFTALPMEALTPRHMHGRASSSLRQTLHNRFTTEAGRGVFSRADVLRFPRHFPFKLRVPLDVGYLSKPDLRTGGRGSEPGRRASHATRTMWRRRALECVCAMQKGAWKDPGDVHERMRGFAKKAAPAKASKGTKKGKHDSSKKQPKRKLDETVGKELQFVLDAFLPQPREKHNMDEETLKQKAAEAKAYSRKKMLEHREWQRNMNTKIRLRQEAIRALPPELVEEASKPDHSLFPLKRMVPTHTIPIPGYEESLRDADLEAMLKQNTPP